MMHRVFGYVCLKVSGILSSICCLDGQIGILPNEKYIKFVQVIMYRDLFGLGPRSCKVSLEGVSLLLKVF